MDQLAYSFWCSRCKFDHAGECSSAQVPLAHPMNQGFAVSAAGVVPAVGSRWVTQIKQRDGTWLVHGLSRVYVATRVSGSRVWIRAADGTGGEMEYGLDPWTPQGTVNWRFIPVP